MDKEKEDATVQDILEIMIELIAEGKKDYVVVCGLEYTLAKKGDKAEVYSDKNFVSLGGYIP